MSAVWRLMCLVCSWCLLLDVPAVIMLNLVVVLGVLGVLDVSDGCHVDVPASFTLSLSLSLALFLSSNLCARCRAARVCIGDGDPVAKLSFQTFMF